LVQDLCNNITLFFRTNKSVARHAAHAKSGAHCTVVRTIRRQFDGKSSTKKNKMQERKPKCSDQIRMEREMELKENSQQRNTGLYLRLLRTSSARLGCNNNAREQDDKNWREQAERKRHNTSFGVASEMLRIASENGLHVEISW
jgi:hypothetical protein